MSNFLFMVILAQQGQGFAEIVGLVLFLVVVMFRGIMAMFTAKKEPAAPEPPRLPVQTRRKNLATQQDTTRNLTAQRSRLEPLRSDKARPDQVDSFSLDRQSHRALARELAPQGEGQRFAVRPGTLDASNLEGQSLEPNVKPTLDSMTGVYDDFDRNVSGAPSPTWNVGQLLSQPEGLRLAVILSEIFNRPAWAEPDSAKT